MIKSGSSRCLILRDTNKMVNIKQKRASSRIRDVKLRPTRARMKRFRELLDLTAVGQEPNPQKLQQLKETTAFKGFGWGEMIHSGWYKHLHQRNLIESARFVMQHGRVGSNSKVLSIGPGGAHIELFLNNEMRVRLGSQPGEVVGVDIDPKILTEAKQIFDAAKSRFPVVPKMLVRGDPVNNGFHRDNHKGRYDTIMAINSLPPARAGYRQFIDDFATTIKWSPKSRVLISALALPPRHDRPVTFMPNEFIRDLREKGFKVLLTQDKAYKSGTEKMRRWLFVARPVVKR